jgi:DNA-binding MarR family transcriptional regulator
MEFLNCVINYVIYYTYMDFYNKVGKMAIGSRLRRLSELLTEQASEVYALYGVEIQPKWFPVFYVLSSGGDKSITQIAQEIGHSHPSVSTIVKEMIKNDVVKKGSGNNDGRENYVRLTEKGFAINERMQPQLTDVNAAVETALLETQNDIWKAIEEWEYLLGQKSAEKGAGREEITGKFSCRNSKLPTQIPGGFQTT